MITMYEFDKALLKKFHAKRLIGIDEAGRGPLAGPVVTAAVILDLDKVIEGLNDSKKLSEKKREVLFKEIAQKAVYKKIFRVEHTYIDEHNILQATFHGIRGCIEGLLEEEEIFIAYDGNQSIPGVPMTLQTTIVKGDAQSATIAAASILAKVSRDEIMKGYSKLYPLYDFKKHKGYGTQAHIDSIRSYGLCPIHRKTFCSNFIE